MRSHFSLPLQVDSMTAQPNKAIAAIRSLIYYLVFYPFTIVYSTFCLLIGRFLSFDTRFKVFTVINYSYIAWLRLCCGVRLDVKGLENLPKDRAYVLVANHQSEFETIFLLTMVRPQCIVLKKELLDIPFFGWALAMLEPIALDRSQRRGALKQLLTQGKARLEAGRPVVIFPQGTRVPVGEPGRFNKGGAMLAASAGVPVVPLAHNAGTCWPGKGFIKYPGVVSVEIGEPVETQGQSVDQVHDAAIGWLLAKMDEQVEN